MVQLLRLLRADGKGFFAQNMLALLQTELAVFVVQGVGGGDIDGLHLRVGGKGFVGVIAAGDAVLPVSYTHLYAWRIPRVVSEWLGKTALTRAERIWFVMDCGSEIGNAAGYNRQLAVQKQLQ